jgi:hypothetical protein
MQEPAACIFSLGNTIPHMYYIYSMSKQYEGSTSYLFPWVQLYSIIHTVAWLSSAAYHCNKNIYTTPLDYSTAFVLVTYSALLALRAVLGRQASVSLVSLCCAAVCAPSGTPFYGSHGSSQPYHLPPPLPHRLILFVFVYSVIPC